MTPFQCDWSGHLWLPGGGVWGHQMCLRCQLIKRTIAPITEYLRIRPR